MKIALNVAWQVDVKNLEKTFPGKKDFLDQAENFYKTLVRSELFPLF
ncbi:MAG: hypothetical protein HPY71_14160 [Firmicutes bacterium]|nr:hypothetical protein [Bacillota bacterium]